MALEKWFKSMSGEGALNAWKRGMLVNDRVRLDARGSEHFRGNAGADLPRPRRGMGVGVGVAGFSRFAASGGRPDAETASFGPERRFVSRISGPRWRFAVKKN